MAKTTHPSHCDIMISDTLHELEMKINEAERIQEMIARLNCFESGAKLPVEVVDFIGNYADIEIVSKEGLLFEAGAILKKAFDSLMEAIKWIIEKLTMIFKYLFNSEYRACRDALDLQRRFLTMSINRTLVNDFESKMCSVISKTDIDNIVFKTQKLVELVRNAANMSRQDFTDTLISTYCSESGVKFDQDTGRVTDDLPNPAPMSGTTFGTAGWTMTGITDTLSNYIATLKQIETLKETSKQCDDAAKDLKKRAEEAALSGVASSRITDLQKECATKICMTKVTGYSIAVCCRRSENILAFLNQLYNAVKEAAK